MTRPPWEVADVIQRGGSRFLDRYRRSLTYPQVKVLNAITRCRTAALGGHLDQCDRCQHRTISYNSCRNRHCPKCQTNARDKWLRSRQQELLPVTYYHVVFSVPHRLVPLMWRNKRALFDLLFEATTATLLEVAANPKRLGALIGFLSVLHTWGQTLQPHPHIHCVVPGGGLSPDQQRWIHSQQSFFLPVRVLSRVFRGKARAMTLTHEEFLRRFLQHVFPTGFPRIRYFGFLANRRRRLLLPLCRNLLKASPASVATSITATCVHACPRCQAPMRIIERLTAFQLEYENHRLVVALDSS
jgi:Transposase zinc-binding domain/Putative transposase